jgi:hypothetical protein
MAVTGCVLITITSIQVESLYFLLSYGTSVGLHIALTALAALLRF